MNKELSTSRSQYFVFRQTMEKMDLSSLGDIVAEVTGESQYDARAGVTHGYGVIASGLTEEQAKKLASRLDSMGLKVFLSNEEDLWRYPEPVSLLSASFHERGGLGQGREEEIHFEWAGLRLMNFAWVDISQTADPAPFPYDEPVKDHLRTPNPEELPKMPVLHKERVLDLFFRDPRMHLRLEESRFRFFYLPEEVKAESWGRNLQTLVRDILCWAPTVMVGPGILRGKQEPVFTDLVFSSFRSLNQFNFWLNQVCHLGPV